VHLSHRKVGVAGRRRRSRWSAHARRACISIIRGTLPASTAEHRTSQTPAGPSARVAVEPDRRVCPCARRCHPCHAGVRPRRASLGALPPQRARIVGVPFPSIGGGAPPPPLQPRAAWAGRPSGMACGVYGRKLRVDRDFWLRRWAGCPGPCPENPCRGSGLSGLRLDAGTASPCLLRTTRSPRPPQNRVGSGKPGP